MTQNYKTTKIRFKAQATPIDYFTIPVDALKADRFNVQRREIPLKPDEHLSAETHLRTVLGHMSETYLLNIQVGKGKTTACYNLIEKFVKQGYKVIVLSPFKKLVEKDYEAVEQKGLSVFHYEQLAGDGHMQYEEHLKCEVQVMTINCLLGNPGDDRYAQDIIKTNYLSELRKLCWKEKQKVIMFFDEIHESIHNFQREFIPNLMKWEGLVTKCFVASATFTPASIPIVEYISLLTDSRITVFETPRVKVANPAELHLHLLDVPYSASNLSALERIASIIKANPNKRIHILSGYKSISKSLTQKNAGSLQLTDAVRSLKPQIITGDSDTPFSEKFSNIGTTFKTGIDIKDPDSVFIIVIPDIGDNSEYGIFFDGLPSIIQAFARIRSKSQIHVFMKAPDIILGNVGKHLDARWQHICINEVDAQNSHFDYLCERYDYNLGAHQKYVRQLMNLIEQGKLSIQYSYPSKHEFLMRSPNLLVKNHWSFGRGLSPYVLWAAMNSQFTNAELKEITLTSKPIVTRNLSRVTLKADIEALITDDEMKQLQALGLQQAINMVLELVSEADDAQVKFNLDGKPTTLGELKLKPVFMKIIIEICAGVALTKEDYIVTATRTAKANSRENIEQLYHALEQYRKQFLIVLSTIVRTVNGVKSIPHDAHFQLPDQFINDVVKLTGELIVDDIFLKSKTYQFLNSLSDVQSMGKQRSMIFKEFEKCFTNVTPNRTQIDGVRHYTIDGTLEKAIPQNLQKLKVFE